MSRFAETLFFPLAAGNNLTSGSLNITLVNSDFSPLSPVAVISVSPNTFDVPISGIATVSSISVNLAGTYRLQCFLIGNPSIVAVSAPFTISIGPASTLVLISAPASASASARMASFVVGVTDAGLVNRVTSGAFTVKLQVDAAPPAAVVGGTLNRTTSGGNTTFNDIIVDVIGVYVFRFYHDAALLVSTAQASVNVFFGVPSSVSFIDMPTNEIATFPFAIAPRVALFDGGRNFLSNFNSALGGSENAVLTLEPPFPGGAVLSGVVSVPFVNGTATFNAPRINIVGSSYVLRVSATAATAFVTGVSQQFTISPGPFVRCAYSFLLVCLFSSFG